MSTNYDQLWVHTKTKRKRQEKLQEEAQVVKSLAMEFTPKSYLSPSICAACKNPFGLRKRYKVFDLTVCEICANEIRLKILRDNQ